MVRWIYENRVIIVVGMIFVLGLATALLSIHVAQLGTGATGWHLPAAIGNPIEALQALERIHSLHVWLLYFGLGAMVVALDLMLAAGRRRTGCAHGHRCGWRSR